MAHDFSGWATKNDIRCSDGRTIRKDAFKDNDGKKVPLVWGHDHKSLHSVLGHAMLENRDEGVYAYCSFNNSDDAKTAKELVEHGDITALSIFANHLKHNGSDVIHGLIREVSLVMAGANPGAYIDSVVAHEDGAEPDSEAIIYSGEQISLAHSDDSDDKKSDDDKKDDKEKKTIQQIFDSMTKEQKDLVYTIAGAIVDGKDVDVKRSDDSDDDKSDDDKKSLKHIFNSMTDEQKNCLYILAGALMSDDENKKDDAAKHDDNLGGNDMKKNLFDKSATTDDCMVISHADQMAIIKEARACGSLKHAIQSYIDDQNTTALQHAEEGEDVIQHSFEEVSALFPEYKDVNPGAPEKLQNDNSWVSAVMDKVHKSPMSRLKVRYADIKNAKLRAKGYTKGNKKTLGKLVALLKRTTDPQTIYVKDELDRDDILDITDFDILAYNYGIMEDTLKEEIAQALFIGDGRDELDANKIHEDKIRPIWTDAEAYTIHKTVDLDSANTALQGGDTSKNFGESYIFAEAVVEASLYAREDYHGKGTPDFWCTPHTLNKMMLARDLNGRRIYNTKAELASALDVEHIYTVENFANKIRIAANGQKKELLGIYVNLSNYSLGAVKGGEITRFSQFDIDFNKEKQLIEARLSGSLLKPQSAIVLEMDTTKDPIITPADQEDEDD